MGGRKAVLLSIDSIRRAIGPACPVLFLAVSLSLSANDASGLSAALFERPRERALGLDAASAVILRAAPPACTGTQWRVEAGEWLLYGIDGLRTHAAAVDIARPSWELRVAASLLDTPVGRESALETGVCASSGRLRCGASIRWETSAVDGCERASLFTGAVSVLLFFADRAALFTRAADIRIAGEPVKGASASAGIAVSPKSTVCAVARLEISSAGAASFRAAARVWLGRRVLCSVGYEEATGALDGSVWIRVGNVGLDAGASFHPVLGVSQSVFVSWGRGW